MDGAKDTHNINIKIPARFQAAVKMHLFYGEDKNTLNLKHKDMSVSMVREIYRNFLSHSASKSDFPRTEL